MNTMSDLETILHDSDLRQVLQAEILGNYINHGPFYVEFHLRDKCDFSCYFCNQRGFRHGGHEWDFVDLEMAIRRLAANGLRMVRLSGGGEPTTYPHIFELLEMVSNLGVTISRLATNGLGLTPGLSQKLIDAKLRVLHVSLQAPTAQSWSKVTGRRESDFDIVLRNVESFLRLDESRETHVYFTFIIDGPTINALPQMFSLCESLGVQLHIHDLNTFTYSDDFLSQSVPCLMEFLHTLDIDYLGAFTFETLEQPRLFLQEKLALAGQSAKQVICLAPWIGFMVRANGVVNPCCAIQTESSILGNVFDQDILDMWYGDTFSALRSEGKRLFFQEGSNGTSKRDLRYLDSRCLGACPVKHGMFGCEITTRLTP